MATKEILIRDIGPVKLYKRRGTRSLKLSISSEGLIRVTLPPWAPYRTGITFVESKKEWINQHRPQSKTPVTDGHRVGKAHRLVLIPSAKNTSVQTRIVNTEIRVFHPQNLPPFSVAVQRAVHRASVRALKLEAENLLSQRLHALAEKHGYSYRGISVKPLKSRWGSCNSNNEITLNVFLVQLPWTLIDYVLLHELTHTKIMAHGKPFWQEMERVLPTVSQLRKEIRGFRPSLQPYVLQA